MSDEKLPEISYKAAEVSGGGNDYRQMVANASADIPADDQIELLLLTWADKDGQLHIHTDVNAGDKLLALCTAVIEQVLRVHKSIHEAPESLQ